MIEIKQIVSKAVDLTMTHGEFIKVENVSKKVQQLKIDQFCFIYTTPFSGIEYRPNIRSYGVSIWFKEKKVFAIDYKDMEDEVLLKRKRNCEWVINLLAL